MLTMGMHFKAHEWFEPYPPARPSIECEKKRSHDDPPKFARLGALLLHQGLHVSTSWFLPQREISEVHSRFDIEVALGDGIESGCHSAEVLSQETLDVVRSDSL